MLLNMNNNTQYIMSLKEASQSGNIKLQTLMDILMNLNKRISEMKKITMEATPIELLNTTGRSRLEIGIEQNFNEYLDNPPIVCESNQTFKSLIRDFLRISSIIMGSYLDMNDELLKEKKLLTCVYLNRNKLRAYIIRALMKWLRDDMMIRRYRNFKEKGNFLESGFFPISLSTYIIKNVLTSSIEYTELNEIILNNNNLSNDTFTMENILINEYITNFKDLKYYLLKHILNLMLKYIEGNASSIEQAYKKFHSVVDINNNEKLNIRTIISLRIYHILINLKVPNKDSENEPFLGEEKTKSLLISDLYDEGEYLKITEKFDKKYKIIYQKLWLAFIRLVMMKNENNMWVVPLPILKNTLEYISDNVIQIISNPLELADIFKCCFDGITDVMDSMDKLAFSVISLNGLFYLIVNNRLNESSFLQSENEENISTGYYRRLYEILTPPVFLLKSRGKFLKLLSISLLSPLIPMTVLCCFIKKLIRISLFTSINNTVFIIALVNSLIKKHRNTLFPILSIDEKDDIYKFVKTVLEKKGGELWSYESGINSFKDNNLSLVEETRQDCQTYYEPNNAHINSIFKENTVQRNQMGIYLSSNFALWEIYILNKSVIPVIRHISNTLTLNASNAKVNHRIHNLGYEELIGINSEDILNFEISSIGGLINIYSSCFTKNKKINKNTTNIIPHNYMENSYFLNSKTDQISHNFFTNSDLELLSLI